MSSSAASAAAMDADGVVFEVASWIRLYQSGRVERLFPDELVAPSLDVVTGVESKDVTINPSSGLSARLYLPPSAPSAGRKLSILFSIHAGGFCLLRSSSSMYHNYINALTAMAGVIAVSVDYRLAPESPLPAAYDDCWEALRWVCGGAANDPWLSDFGDLDKVIVSGESSGGNIVHNLGLRLGSEGKKVEGLMILHPYFWGKERIGEEAGEGEEKKRKVEDTGALWPVVCPEAAGLDDPWINPVADGAPSLAGLGCRRVLVCVAGLDLLRERGRLYYEKLRESGWEGEAEFIETEGEDHGFFLIPGSSKTEELREQLASFINKP